MYFNFACHQNDYIDENILCLSFIHLNPQVLMNHNFHSAFTSIMQTKDSWKLRIPITFASFWYQRHSARIFRFISIQ